MSISISCGKCNKQLRVKDELTGKRVKCPVCGNVLQVAVASVAPEPSVGVKPATAELRLPPRVHLGSTVTGSDLPGGTFASNPKSQSRDIPQRRLQCCMPECTGTVDPTQTYQFSGYKSYSCSQSTVGNKLYTSNRWEGVEHFRTLICKKCVRRQWLRNAVIVLGCAIPLVYGLLIITPMLWLWGDGGAKPLPVESKIGLVGIVLLIGCCLIALMIGKFPLYPRSVGSDLAMKAHLPNLLREGFKGAQRKLKAPFAPTRDARELGREN